MIAVLQSVNGWIFGSNDFVLGSPFIPGSCIQVQDRSSAVPEAAHFGSKKMKYHANTSNLLNLNREHNFLNGGSRFETTQSLLQLIQFLVVWPATKIENPSPTPRNLTQNEAKTCLAGPLPRCGPLGYFCSMSIPLLLKCNGFLENRGMGFWCHSFLENYSIQVILRPFGGIAIQSKFSWPLRNYCGVLRPVLDRTKTQMVR